MIFPKVSILIPTYNQSAFIRQGISSALMQDYPNLEVVVSDDSTDDKTEQLVSEFAHDGRLKYIHNKPSLGKADNYRKLLYEYSLGEWVVNLDGDDHYTDSNFISAAIKSIFKAGASDVIFYMASQLMVWPERQEILQPKLPADETVMSAWNYYYKIYSFKHFSHLSTLYNAALAKESGFYERKISSSDMNSFFKLCLRHPDKKVILSKKSAGNWVLHGGNESTNYTFKTYFNNGRHYFGIFKFAMKNKAGTFGKNFFWLSQSLFLYWGSYVKRIFIKRK